VLTPSARGSSSAPLHNRCGPHSRGERHLHRSLMFWPFSGATKAWHGCATRRPPRFFILGKTRPGHHICQRNSRHWAILRCTLGWDTHTARSQFEGSTMDAKTSAKNKTGTLAVGNNNWDLPVLPGTIGPEVVDISKLYGQSGMFTYDPGF